MGRYNQRREAEHSYCRRHNMEHWAGVCHPPAVHVAVADVDVVLHALRVGALGIYICHVGIKV